MNRPVLNVKMPIRAEDRCSSAQLFRLVWISAALLMAALAANAANAAGPSNGASSSSASATNGTANSNPSITTTLPSASQSPSLKNDLQYNLSLSGTGFGDDHNNAETVGFGLGVNYRRELNSMFELHLRTILGLESGHAQSQFGDNVPSSGITLKEAVLNFRPVDFFIFSGGAINQGKLDAPLLISNRAFPGAEEKIVIGSRKLGAELSAEQTIPTSTTMATQTVDKEPTPTFLAETLTLQAIPVRNWFVKAQGSHFRFTDLPSQVAVASELQGNSINELGPNTSRYIYNFEGFVAGGSTSVRLSNWFMVTAGAQVVQNTQAPTDSGLAQMQYLESEIAFSGRLKMIPRAENFFAESDVSPAFYNSSEYGHNNRQGYAGSLDFLFPENHFKIGGRYVSADVINPNLYQSRLQYFMIRFETQYGKM